MMDLFAAAGIDSDDGAGGGGRSPRRTASRTLRVPLFNNRVIEEARRRAIFSPSEQQLATAASYARTARSNKFARQTETAVRNLFFDEVLGTILGYRKYDPDEPYTLAFERPVRRGAVDVALGLFPGPDGKDEIVAPFELKGPGTIDLDLIPPGRRRSPVQQAWDYAIDAPGSRWVLVSNCVEVRLYGFGRGRDAYEVFDLGRLDEEEEHARLWLILSSDRLLGGATDALLSETDSTFKTITNELYKEYSELRTRLIEHLVNFADGPKLAPLNAIELAQKILDRVLFVAFAQRTDLLPKWLLKRVTEARNEFDPKPIWTNMQSLFRFLNEGRRQLDITAYNGGLFAPDPVADSLELPDQLTIDLARLDEWDYRSDVPVTVLGHLFEQSVTDIEKMRAEKVGKPPPAVTSRKRHGIVYTPDIITRFLVEHTIGLTLHERFDALLAQHGKSAAAQNDDDALFEAGEEGAEQSFWRDYLGILRSLTILDPACGSGAFLVAAFDHLAGEYRRVVERLADLGHPVDFDLFDEIVTKNLFGVDINAESVEITRLSLWLKTARRKHRLQNLEATIKVGDSLIDDPAFTDRPFDWRAGFREVFAAGGFDVVIGNPPYVRMELLKPIKPYLEQHYVVAADRADLYAYFFERGVGLLKDGGRLGYISSSTFFRTGSGENLRQFLGDRVGVEAVIDFGDLQIFEGVTTYPAIVTLKKGVGDGDLAFLKVEERLPKDLIAAFEDRARPMPRARLGAGSWRFEDEPLAHLRDKIMAGRKTLGEVYGPPLYGIKTGYNKAFVIDRETRDRLVAADPRSDELLKPFLRGENVKRWRVESEGLFLINTPRGKVNIDDYPAIRNWLMPFKPELEKRATKQEWFELQQAQLAYQPLFDKPKVVYLDIASGPPFAFDPDGTFIDCTIFMIHDPDGFVLPFLNSKLAWFQWLGETPIASGGYIRLKQQYISPTRLPNGGKNTNSPLIDLGHVASVAAKLRFETQSTVRRRLMDLAAPAAHHKFSRKLENWWELDFAAFRAEVKRVFRADIPVKERGDWESYLAENAAEVRRLTSTIADAEAEIDAIVYRLFDLTADEVRLLEASIAGQY